MLQAFKKISLGERKAIFFCYFFFMDLCAEYLLGIYKAQATAWVTSLFTFQGRSQTYFPRKLFL